MLCVPLGGGHLCHWEVASGGREVALGAQQGLCWVGGFQLPGATLGGSTTPHFRLMNYFPRGMDLHRDGKATVLVGQQEPEALRRVLCSQGLTGVGVGDMAVGCRAAVSGSPHLHTHLSEVEVIKQCAGSLTA